MNRLNKKGFTLVELLAVTIILILILIIAFNTLDSISKKSKLKSVKANSLSYYKEANNFAQVSDRSDITFRSGKYTVSELTELGVKVSGTKPDSGFISFGDYGVNCGCLKYGKYIVKKNMDGTFTEPKKGTCNIESAECPLYGTVIDYEYTGQPILFKAFKPGKYKIELWGAEGANYNTSIAGKGAYTSGVIDLNQDDVLYIYVGGTANLKTGGFNGGANGGTTTDGTYYGGGGSTDVRLVSGSTWNDSESLASRIMVAAGGAGAGYYQGNINGGSGGTLTGVSGTQSGPGSSHTVATGGTQISAGLTINGAQSSSGFGFASQTNTYGTGAGSGYYGGGSGSATNSKVSGGAGGSSFISGLKGCVAIKSATEIEPKDGCDNGTTDVTCSYHYSGLKFTDAYMKSGNDVMPSYVQNQTNMVGNSGNGHARISKVPDTDYDE